MNRTLLIFLQVLFLTASLHAQKKLRTDSLRNALAQSAPDTNRVKTLQRLSWEYRTKGKYDSAMYFARQSAELAEKLNFRSGLAEAWNHIGLAYYRKGEYADALESHRKSLAMRLALNDTAGAAVSYNNIGLVHSDVGNYDKAIENYMEARKLRMAAADSQGVAVSNNNLGIVYHYLGDDKKAVYYFESALRIEERLQEQRGMAFSYNNLGIIYHEQGNNDLALENFMRSLEIKKRIGDTRGIAGCYLNAGAAWVGKGEEEKGLEHFFLALALMDTIGDRYGVINACLEIGKLYTSQEKYKEAKVYLDRALDLALETRSVEWQKSCYEAQAQLAEATGKFADALRFQKEFMKAKDSLTNDEITKSTVRTEMNYEFEQEKELARAEQNKIEAIRTEREEKQELIMWIISGSLVVAIVLAGFIFRNYRQKQKANENLELAYRIIENKNQEITDSINYAQRIQRSILPEIPVIRASLPELFIFYKPKDIVGGDFYYFDKGTDDTVFIAAADCTGHGVPGAFMSLVCSRELKLANSFSGSPARILSLVNRGVRETLRQNQMEGTRDGMDIAFLKIARGKIVFSGANRPIWIFTKGASQPEEIKPTKAAIGGSTPDDQVYEEHQLATESGDLVYLFSDGYSDQFGGDKGKKLTTKKFRELLITIKDEPMQQQQETLSRFMEEWRGNQEQVDDLLVIGIKIG
jgi:serine phosphatase RsbU (regulator of sigma subunit)